MSPLENTLRGNINIYEYMDGYNYNHNFKKYMKMGIFVIIIIVIGIFIIKKIFEEREDYQNFYP